MHQQQAWEQKLCPVCFCRSLSCDRLFERHDWFGLRKHLTSAHKKHVVLSVAKNLSSHSLFIFCFLYTTHVIRVTERKNGHRLSTSLPVNQVDGTETGPQLPGLDCSTEQCWPILHTHINTLHVPVLPWGRRPFNDWAVNDSVTRAFDSNTVKPERIFCWYQRDNNIFPFFMPPKNFVRGT